jgi:hypothetical protein
LVGGSIWRAGFSQIFPEIVDPPSLGSAVVDFAMGGLVGTAVRAVGVPVANLVARSSFGQWVAARAQSVALGDVPHVLFPAAAENAYARTSGLGQIILNSKYFPQGMQSTGNALLRTTLRHEFAHRMLRPLLGPLWLRQLRQAFTGSFYGSSAQPTTLGRHLLFLEEFMAETFAMDSALAGWSQAQSQVPMSAARGLATIIGGAATGLAGVVMLGGLAGSAPAVDATEALFGGKPPK